MHNFIIYISLFFLFSIYFLFYFFISKEQSYLWISFLFTAILYPPIGFLMSSIHGIRFNYMFGPMGYSLGCVIIIEFLRKILLPEKKFPRFDKTYYHSIRFYIICFFVYLYDASQYPDGEYFKNLIKYLYGNLGPGSILIFASIFPAVVLILTSISLRF